MTDARKSHLSPQMTLIELAEGYRISKALDVVAELGIADLLNESAKTCEELAQATSTHAPTLYRLMRAMAGSGIFREDNQGRFENTPLSEVLRTNVPHSVRDSVRFIPNDGSMLAWMRLMDVLKTGKSSYKDATGFSAWEYMQEHPEKQTLFNKNMTFFSSELAPVILDSYDFSALKSVVDMGGGEGLLLASILEKYPHLHGVLFDIPAVTEQAKTYLHQQQGLASRCDIIAGSILEEIPAGYDAYIMKNVLHDWSDEDTLKIFQGCRKALPDHGKLIIFDAVMLPGNEPQKTKWLDLQMLIAFGGQERTEAEFEKLLSRANFKMTKATPLPTPIGMGIIEATPT